MSTTPLIKLSRTSQGIPQVGLGLWKAEAGKVGEIVIEAIKAGYRHFDCACDYGNEAEIGDAFAKCFKDGLVKREDLFITSKLWNTYHAKEHVEPAIRKTLSDLKMDYLDLYLIHFPIPLKYVPFEKRYPPEWVHDPQGSNPVMEYANIPYRETWEAMENLIDLQLTKNIGVCNLTCVAIMDLLTYAKIKPAMNQVELHPYLTQETLISYCHSKGIQVTGFSNLGSSSYIALNMDQGHGVGILKEPLVLQLAEKYGKSVAQIVLRWNTQRNVIIIPKTTHVARLSENLNIFDFTLSDDDMKTISNLNKNLRYNDPGEFCKGMGGSCPIYG